jgi:hypothetical protein
MPEAESTSTAFGGQTATHGVLSPQCWHIKKRNAARASPFASRRWTRIHVMPLRSFARSGAGGTLFSTAQATAQVPQPLHLSRSITMP